VKGVWIRIVITVKGETRRNRKSFKCSLKAIKISLCDIYLFFFVCGALGGCMECFLFSDPRVLTGGLKMCPKIYIRFL